MIDRLKLIVLALILAFLQSFLLEQVDMGFWLRPMPYILLFLSFPLNFSKYIQLVIAFVFGTFIDLLSGSFGTNSASCVFLVYIKQLVDTRFVDFDSIKLQGENYINIRTKGWVFFAYYIFGLTFSHHFVFFSLDFFEFSSIIRILIITFVSTLGTISLVLLFKSIFRI